jgi:hypothetical protein
MWGSSRTARTGATHEALDRPICPGLSEGFSVSRGFNITDQGDGWLSTERVIHAQALESESPGGKHANVTEWLVELRTPMRDPATNRETNLAVIVTDDHVDLTNLDEELWSSPLVLVDPATAALQDVRQGTGWTSIKVHILPGGQ